MYLSQICWQVDQKTKGPKGHISCTWVHWCATFPMDVPGLPSCFSDQSEKHKLCRGCWDLASCQVSLNSVKRFQREKSKMSRPIKGQGGNLVFLISPKYINLVENVEILRSVKFHWILFSGFRREVENGSDNQRPGGHLVFPNGPKTQTW